MTRQNLLCKTLVPKKYLYQTRWDTESVFNMEISILLAHEFMEYVYAYIHLLIKIKQQNLTDNNLLNLIKFGQVNEKLMH